MKIDIAFVQETMAAAQNTRDRVQAKNCELQQQLAEQQRAAEDIHKELATAKDRQMVRQMDKQTDRELAEQQRAAEDIHKELATAKDRQMDRQIDGQLD